MEEEEDLPKEEIYRLEELYKIQIAILDITIENYKREISRLKKLGNDIILQFFRIFFIIIKLNIL